MSSSVREESVSQTREAFLYLMLEDGGRQRFPRLEDDTIIGRRADCGIVLDSRNVSREHARIFRRGDTYYIEDLGSSNGTYVNYLRADEPTPLSDGALIHLSTLALYFTQADETHLGEPAILAEPIPTEPAIEPAHSIELPLDAAALNDPAAVLRETAAFDKTLGIALETDVVLGRILDGLFAAFSQAEYGMLLWPDAGDGQPLNLRASRYRRSDTESGATLMPVRRSLAQRAFDERKAMLFRDAAASGADPQSVLEAGARSALCVPLLDGAGQAIAVVQLDTSSGERPFTRHDLELLAVLTPLAARGIEAAELHEGSAEGGD